MLLTDPFMLKLDEMLEPIVLDTLIDTVPVAPVDADTDATTDDIDVIETLGDGLKLVEPLNDGVKTADELAALDKVGKGDTVPLCVEMSLDGTVMTGEGDTVTPLALAFAEIVDEVDPVGERDGEDVVEPHGVGKDDTEGEVLAELDTQLLPEV